MKNNVFKALFALIVSLIMLVSGCALNITKTDNVTPKNPASSSAASIPEQEAVAYVTIDVNPSIELTITGGVVSKATAFNDDGASVILGTDVTGFTPEAAIAAIVAQLSADGYLKADAEASLVITVTGSAENGLTDSLEEAAKQNIEMIGVDCEVIAACVPADIAQTAKEYGLSTGKYMMLSYIAEQKGITIEEAIAQYGSLPMEKIFEYIEAIDEFLTRIDDWNDYIAGLPAEQQAIISAALQAYREAMRTAESAFEEAKKAAESSYKTAKDAAEAAYEADHDKEIWEQAKETLKKAFEEAKKAAHKAFDDAKAAAKSQFVTAVAGLGLSKEIIEKLLHWDLDDFSLIGLPDDQQDIISAALKAYGEAMRAAESVFKQAKKDAQNTYKAARDAAEAAYKSDNNKDIWKQTEKTIKEAFEEAKKAAEQAFRDAKAAAKAQFIAAVAGLGLSDKVIEKLLKWDFDLNFALPLLPAEEQQIISAALQAYKQAMSAAEIAFKQTKKNAEIAYKAAKEEAETAYKSGHDKDKWKQAEKAIKKAFEEAKKSAQQAFKDAKAAAKAQFIAAVEGFGLSDKAIEKLLKWDFDLNFELPSLPADDQQIISAALHAYKEAISEAEQTFKHAKKNAEIAYKAAKEEAKAAYELDHDKDKRKQAEKAAKKAFEEAKKNAPQIFKDSKAAAKSRFIAAVAGLGLSDKAIKKLLK